MNKVIALVGPTASGKSWAAMKLAENLGGAIVGADSVQVYRGFDIGSAKPSRDEQMRIPHALIDVADPDTEFSAADYAAQAAQAVADFQAGERIPLVVGGTGFYLRALFDGLAAPEGKDPALRAELEALPTAVLRERLVQVDPQRAAAVGENDRFRLIRALEIYQITGMPPSVWAGRARPRPKWDVLWLGILPERTGLYRRIAARIEQMWRGGWLDEVRSLAERGYGATRPMQSVGYAEVFAHLYGGVSEADAMEAACRRTRRYAKRQLTWFRAVPHVNWIESKDEQDLRDHGMKRMIDHALQWLS